jgi:hypothetical protein
MNAATPVRIAKWLGLAYAAAVLAFSLWGADAADSAVLSLLFWPWIVGPAALAAMGAKASRTAAGAWAFAALEGGVIASTGLGWFYLIFVAPDAQNGIAMAVSLPLLQYVLVGMYFALAWLLGWRARDSWLKD